MTTQRLRFSRWWFQVFFNFHPELYGEDEPILRIIFFKGVGSTTTNRLRFCFTALGASKSNQLVEVVALAPAEPMEDLARFKLPMLPPGAPVELGWLVERWVLFFWKLGKIMGKSDRGGGSS